MKYCPVCGANVEGLIHRCDCCGALLRATTPFVVWHTFVTEASGDVYTFMNEIFCKIDEIDFSQHYDVLQMIEVNVFCYPNSIITERRIKNRHYLSSARKKASITVVLNYDEYIRCGSVEKKAMLRAELEAGFLRIRSSAVKFNNSINQLLDSIIKAF